MNPKIPWYLVRVWFDTIYGENQAMQIAGDLQQLGGKGSLIYFARYTILDAAEKKLTRAVTRVEFHFLPARHLTSLQMRKRLKKYKPVKRSATPREGPGSLAHAKAFELAWFLVQNKATMRLLQDVRHWLHNMVGMTYADEVNSYAESICAYSRVPYRPNLLLAPEPPPQDEDPDLPVA